MKIFLLLCFIVFSFLLYGQDSCVYNFDTDIILSNKNLKKLVDSIQATTLVTKNDKKYIPQTLIEVINCWGKHSGEEYKFSIANPDEFYNSTDIGLPERQIIYLGVNENYLLMTYRFGGLGVTHHIMIVKFKEGQIIDFWIGYGSELKTKKQILSYIKKNENKLQSNLIDM